jgi:glutaredoxin
MESRGLEFEMVNVDLVPDAADELRAMGFRQLPVVVAGETRWSGFRPDMINRLHPHRVWPAHEHPRLLLQQLGKHAAVY